MNGRAGRVVGALLAGAVSCTAIVSAQQTAAQSGEAIFRANCTRCHGADARGFTGPDLTIAAARPDAATRLIQIIKTGIPGTDMPAAVLTDAEVAMTAEFLRAIARPAAAPATFALAGDTASGEKLFWQPGGCGSCHRVNGRGGRLGPDLSRGVSITSPRARDAAVADIRRPSDTIARAYQTIAVVTPDGTRVRGLRRNEDTFSVQLLDTDERLRGFLKKDLRAITVEPRSLMPDYDTARLSDGDLDDLLQYLASLRARSMRRDAR